MNVSVNLMITVKRRKGIDIIIQMSFNTSLEWVKLQLWRITNPKPEQSSLFSVFIVVIYK